MSTPAQPCLTACAVSLTVSIIEQQPVPGIMRDAFIPAATTSSSNIARSSTASEFASLFVPNAASPQFCESNHLQCSINRWLSGERSALHGVTTGANTPRIRSVMVYPSASCPSYFLIPPSTFLWLLPFFFILLTFRARRLQSSRSQFVTLVLSSSQRSSH